MIHIGGAVASDPNIRNWIVVALSVHPNQSVEGENVAELRLKLGLCDFSKSKFASALNGLIARGEVRRHRPSVESRGYRPRPWVIWLPQENQ